MSKIGLPPREFDPPKSKKAEPHFLNVPRVLDTPEALGLLAPTPLTIIGGLDPAFDRPAKVYRLTISHSSSRPISATCGFISCNVTNNCTRLFTKNNQFFKRHNR